MLHITIKFVKSADEDNDNQPEVLTVDVLENQRGQAVTNLPRRIKLMTKKETMQCRKVKAVIRFHKPKMTTEPERYFHHFLILFYPWQCESDLRGLDGSFSSKFRDRTVIEIIETNRIKFEPYAEAVDAALQYVQNNPQYSLYGERFNAFGEQENSEVQN